MDTKKQRQCSEVIEGLNLPPPSHTQTTPIGIGLCMYSKTLRCTIQGEWKNSCSSKFVQLELLTYVIRQRQDHQKTFSLRFSLHKFVYLKFFWTLFKNVHCQGPCNLRPCISRPYCTYLSNIQGHPKYPPVPPALSDTSKHFHFHLR